jgi:hypothetical protein
VRRQDRQPADYAELNQAFTMHCGGSASNNADREADGDADRSLMCAYLLGCIERLYFAMHSPRMSDRSASP